MRFVRVGLLCAAVCVVGGPVLAGQGAKTGTLVIKNGKGGQTKNQDPFNIKGKGEAAWLKFKGKHKKKGDAGKPKPKPKGNSEKPWHILPSW